MIPEPIICHRDDCDTPATQQWHRQATDEETAAHHRAVDDYRRTRGLPPMPEDAAIRAHPVTLPVFGCDEHGSDQGIKGV